MLIAILRVEKVGIELTPGFAMSKWRGPRPPTRQRDQERLGLDAPWHPDHTDLVASLGRIQNQGLTDAASRLERLLVARLLEMERGGVPGMSMCSPPSRSTIVR